jgi:hypothetical protein
MRRLVLGPARAALFACALAGLVACGDGFGPVPCGRNQHAEAHVVLPDTGLDHGRDILVGFIQHDPDLAGELSEIAIQQRWPQGAGIDPEPDPRVRLVREDGLVLLDTLGTRLDQPRGTFDRPTWIVLQWIKDAARRNAIFESMRDQTLWLELWAPGAAKPGTRVRLETISAGVNPPAMCA